MTLKECFLEGTSNSPLVFLLKLGGGLTQKIMKEKKI